MPAVKASAEWVVAQFGWSVGSMSRGSAAASQKDRLIEPTPQPWLAKLRHDRGVSCGGGYW